ncbi:MAG: tripartite tricarboxylate transporter substrate binding protein [Hyphomicrobiales bacterium]|nr:tripartite tricarboxylate transporter substrate binding protein [Alphaproteobacteria bacterium]
MLAPRPLLLALAAALMAMSPDPAQAEYPDRPVTAIVPFAPGGPAEIIGRILSTFMPQTLGQSVIIENRGGAAGNIGMGQAARAKPDGYTLLMTSTAISVNTALFNNLPYDPIKDFAPISELVNAPNVLVVRPDSGIATIAELVTRVKSQPNTFSYGSPGAGTKSHLTGEQLKLRAGIDMVHVPFRGAGPAAQAVLAGQIQVASVALAAAEPLVKSGDLRALAVTGAQRWFSLPDVPTMIESGYPGFVSDTFNALFAPAGTPHDIIAVLLTASQAAMNRPEAADAARKAGFQIVASGPAQLARRVAAEIDGVKELVARAGTKPEN